MMSFLSKRYTAPFIVIMMLFWNSNSFGATKKVYTHTVKQPFGGSQSPDDARIAALMKAKREVLESAGTYIESLTVVKNSMIEKDQIIALSAGVLNAEIISQENYANDEGFGIIVTAEVAVDTSALEDKISNLIDDKDLLEKNIEMQERITELLKKIDELEKENMKLKSASAKPDQKLKKDFGLIGERLKAAEITQRALKEFSHGNFSEPSKAMELLNEAIELDPRSEKAYVLRAMAHRQMEQYNDAIADCNTAIDLNPNSAKAFTFRGFVHRKMGNFREAIEDCNVAIDLNPKYARAYHIRGSVFIRSNMKDLACNDFRKACELGDCRPLRRAQNLRDCQ